MNTYKAETADLIADCDVLISLLQNKEDEEFKNIHEVFKTEQEISNLRECREKQIQENSEALTKALSEEIRSLEKMRKENATKELEQLEKELETASEHKQINNKLCEELEEKIQKQKAILEEMTKQQHEFDETVNTKQPSLLSNIHLYRYLTGICWQQDADEHEVKGYISSKNKVKTFSLSTQHNSQFFITNYLWDQLETDW